MYTTRRCIGLFSVANKLKQTEKLRKGLIRQPAATHTYKDFVGTGSYQLFKDNLSPFQRYLVENKAMERPFTGQLWSELDAGFYHCVICNTRLFCFDHKFDAKSGYPSFWKCVEQRVTAIDEEVAFDSVNYARHHRTLADNPVHKRLQCTQCRTHLGALFFDGPPPSLLRYSINSAMLQYYELEPFEDPNIRRKQAIKEKEAKIIKYI